MAAGRPRGPNDPGVLSSLETALREVRRPGPVELSWNWRWELGALAFVAAPAALIYSAAGLLGLAVTAGAGLAAGTATTLCWPSARRWLIARAWCVITPHRIRAGCASAWVQTRSGHLPVVLSAVPAPYGERVRLWLRAGLTAGDLHAARDVLAAACWAAEVHVLPSARHAHLVTLDVIRVQRDERAPHVPDPWTFPRQVTGEGQGEAEDRDTLRWPGAEIPVP